MCEKIAQATWDLPNFFGGYLTRVWMKLQHRIWVAQNSFSLHWALTFGVGIQGPSLKFGAPSERLDLVSGCKKNKVSEKNINFGDFKDRIRLLCVSYFAAACKQVSRREMLVVC